MFEVYGTKFNIDERYSFVKALGKGAYGVVCSAKDAKTGRKVAIKKICPMAKSVYDAKHTLREVRLLRHCGQHPNVITLLDLMINEANDELYIGMECMDTDLHRIIQSSQKLSVSHHKHFMYQLILGIEFLHSHGILHRDLKPANLLVSKNCDLRISDFGLARRAPDATDGKPLMTEHVVTRWYRPPELMLSPDGKYTAAVDVWSCGCIFAELLGRTPLFPGKNFVHQLQLIFDVIGTPHPQQTTYIKNSQAIQFLRSLPNKGPVDLASIYPHACKDSIDFMAACICFSAKDRITVVEALAHPFFANAPLKDKPIEMPTLREGAFNFEFEQQDLNEKELREIIVDEVVDFTLERKLRPVGHLRPARRAPSREGKVADPLYDDQEEKLREPASARGRHSKSGASRSMSARAAKTTSHHPIPVSTRAHARPQSAQDAQYLAQRSDSLHSRKRLHQNQKPRSHARKDYHAATGPVQAAAQRQHLLRHSQHGTATGNNNNNNNYDDDDDDDLFDAAAQPPHQVDESMADALDTSRRRHLEDGGDASVRYMRLRTHSSASEGPASSSTSAYPHTERENDINGNAAVPAPEQRLKKKSRSFTSRILGSTSMLSSSSKRAERLPSLHRASTAGPTTRHNLASADDASPMSCSSGGSRGSCTAEDSKVEPFSSMLPIKSMLRKSKRHIGSSCEVTTDPRGEARAPRPSSRSSSSSSSSMRGTTVPQPFNLSHSRTQNARAPYARAGSGGSNSSSGSSSEGGLGRHYGSRSAQKKPKLPRSPTFGRQQMA